ncbi:hypothetical protein LTS15_002576 [Exophiala xenobiotica]|nr:hypothetical protein LTS15_002576 [Exophiala xenobiotica]
MFSITLGIVGLLGAVLVTRTLISALLSPLRRIPGPFLARFTRLWQFVEIGRGQFEKTNLELHDKYGRHSPTPPEIGLILTIVVGPIVRIAPNEYSLDDFEAAKTIYGHPTSFVKAPWYIASADPDPHQPRGLFTDRDIKHHAESRRKVSSVYSMTALLTMEPHVTDCVNILVDKFREFAHKGQVINMSHWLQCYAFDVIGVLTLGQRFGLLDDGLDREGILAAIDQYLAYLSVVGVYSEIHRFLGAILQKLSSGGGLAYMRAFSKQQIQEHVRSGEYREGEGKDFATKLLKLHQENPKKITMQDVIMTCGTNIGAGSDTTSISLGSVVYSLIKHPKVMRKLREEIDQGIATGHISAAITFQDAQRMPYLQAVIKEALRVHPATGLPLGRVVPKGGATLAGKFFPEGTIVGINSWVAHANRQVFGDDARSFRPERWLQDQEQVSRMDRYYMTFGLGSRTCIGKNISLMEMQKVIPQLARHFDFELVTKEWKTRNVWFVKQEQFECRIRLRKC